MRALIRARAVRSRDGFGSRRAAAVGLNLALAAGLPGCPLGDDEPRPATGATAEIGGVVEQLERAIARGDFRRVCDELLSVQARRAAGGDDCSSLLRSAAKGLRDPTIEPQSVELRRGGANVRVEASAGGGEAVGDTLELVREDGRWRIASLAE